LLAQRLTRPGLIVAPGIFDGVSAKLADRFGFDCLYMTGYGSVASSLGLPDAGLASFTQMLDRVTMIARAVHTPFIADGDTGYGGLLNVAHTVRGYEDAGASAIQLEDQAFPKKCGHTPNRRVIAADDMVRKIRVAVEARASKDFLVVARTDARTSHGLDEALRRAELYGKAGADILFVESPESEDEMRVICERVEKPLLANMVEGGRTPVKSREVLEQLGYKIAIFPITAMLAATQAMAAVYGTLKSEGSSAGATQPLYPFTDMSVLMGFQAIWDFEKKYAEE
jgi:2-methylisocitrate lyase-like PEP mutase family enzyme